MKSITQLQTTQETNPLQKHTGDIVQKNAKHFNKQIHQNKSYSKENDRPNHLLINKKAPRQRSEIELKPGVRGEKTQKVWVGEWQSDAIEKAIDVFFTDIFDKSLFKNRITEQQRTSILENYQELINNSLDQALRIHLANPEGVGLGLFFGASIKKATVGDKTFVIIKVWDNKGGFPQDKLGKQAIPEELPIAKVRDEDSLYLGGLGIGTQRMIKNVGDAGGQVLFQNGDFGKGTGAVVMVGFPYIADE